MHIRTRRTTQPCTAATEMRGRGQTLMYWQRENNSAKARRHNPRDTLARLYMVLQLTEIETEKLPWCVAIELI